MRKPLAENVAGAGDGLLAALRLLSNRRARGLTPHCRAHLHGPAEQGHHVRVQLLNRCRHQCELERGKRLVPRGVALALRFGRLSALARGRGVGTDGRNVKR